MEDLPKPIIDGIVRICSDDPHAKVILREVVKRERVVPTTDLYRLRLTISKGGYKLNDLEVAQFFEKLQKLGIGKVHYAKLPLHNSFSWKFNLLTVAKIGLRGHLLQTAPNVKTSLDAPESIRLYCQIGDATVPLTLPRSFNLDQARALSRYLEQIAKQNEAGEL